MKNQITTPEVNQKVKHERFGICEVIELKKENTIAVLRLENGETKDVIIKFVKLYEITEKKATVKKQTVKKEVVNYPFKVWSPETNNNLIRFYFGQEFIQVIRKGEKVGNYTVGEVGNVTILGENAEKYFNENQEVIKNISNVSNLIINE